MRELIVRGYWGTAREIDLHRREGEKSLNPKVTEGRTVLESYWTSQDYILFVILNSLWNIWSWQRYFTWLNFSPASDTSLGLICALPHKIHFWQNTLICQFSSNLHPLYLITLNLWSGSSSFMFFLTTFDGPDLPVARVLLDELT